MRKIEPVDADWRQVRYLIFELPGAAGDFSERIRQMRAIVELTAVPWLQVVEQTRATHRADAAHVTGRSEALLKLKPRQDAEAVVVGYTPGTGKYQGMTGALAMEMPDGKRFHIGSGLTDALRRVPPPIGARITYRYQHPTKKGVPRFPRYLRMRKDFY